LIRARHRTEPDEWPHGWLVTEHVLHEVRGRPPRTTAAIIAGRTLELDEDRRFQGLPNDSDMPGALTRVAGLVAGIGREAMFQAGARATASTHGGVAAYLAGGIAAGIFACLLDGESLDQAVTIGTSEAAAWPGGEAIVSAIRATAAPPMTGAVGTLRRAIELARSADASAFAACESASRQSTAISVLTAQLVGASRGALAFSAAWRAAPDVVAVTSEMADATSLARRTWVLGEELPAGITRRYATSDSPLTAHLWPRFPGY
jgi:hypothetical protein